MKTAIKGLALASMLLMAAGSAFAGVTVTFSSPEKFSDLPFASWERKEVLDELSEHFQKLAQALPPGGRPEGRSARHRPGGPHPSPAAASEICAC